MRSSRFLTVMIFVMAYLGSADTAYAQSASPGDNLVVCGNSNWGGLAQPRTLAMRQKLSNTTYFGPGGAYSESTFTFVVIGTPTTANLTANNCNIWFSGYDNNPSFTDLQTFVNNGGFVIAGCDNSAFAAACNGLGVTVLNYSNLTAGYTVATPINPLTCDGGSQNLSLALITAGGASGYFSSGVTLATYADGSNLPLAITDNVSSPNYILTGDIDMFTTNNPTVTTGSLITSDQDKFIANNFKLAADKVTGVLGTNGEPSCENISVPVFAVDDTASVGSSATGVTILNVLTNDHWNSSPVTTSDVTISVASGSSVPSALNFDTGTGNVSLNGGAAVGTYFFDYTICLVSDPGVCRTATVQITVIASPSLSILISSSLFVPLVPGSGFALPGEDVIYTVLVENSGLGTVDNDAVFVIDEISADTTFFNGDIDTGGSDLFASTDPIVFTDGGSGLTFNYASDVAYSDSVTPPNQFLDCTYVPASGYDANVRYICLNPKGIFAAGSPTTSFTLNFRARIN